MGVIIVHRDVRRSSFQNDTVNFFSPFFSQRSPMHQSPRPGNGNDPTRMIKKGSRVHDSEHMYMWGVGGDGDTIDSER